MRKWAESVVTFTAADQKEGVSEKLLCCFCCLKQTKEELRVEGGGGGGRGGVTLADVP